LKVTEKQFWNVGIGICICISSIGVALGTFASAKAQTTITESQFFKLVQADSSYFLDFWILPKSITVIAKRDTIRNDRWHYDVLNGTWTWNPQNKENTSPSTLDSVTIRYERYPLALKRRYYERTIVEEDTSYNSVDDEKQKVAKQTFTEEDLFGDVNIDRSGSLTRGITLGSNNDVSLESGLRFNLNGNLTDNLEITASLTDENTPIQPDGSTQNLREFDQVFIKMNTQNSALQLGDIDLSLRDSEFAQIGRRLQGIKGNTQTDYGDYKAAFSVARGRFKTVEFNGRDGVQGPYRLLGNNNNQFITVLAGSERVYIDGNLMTRGQQNDYIIDYGLGEIEFTNKRIITDQTRIVVDYQFIEQDFTRTLLAGEAKEQNLLNGKLSIGATVIREADSDNLQESFGLSNSDLNALRRAGDSAAVVSGADSVGFSQNTQFLLYAKVDTTFNGESVTIFKHLPGDSSSVFRVQFRRLGGGLGAYKRVGQASNGVLFEWVGPGRGAYEPFRELPAPQQQRMVAIKSRYKATDKIEIYGEVAGSSFDQNRFSSIDDGNNFDEAYKAGFLVDNIETSLGTFRTEIKQRYTGKNFEFFDRTRQVEFDRKWNISGQIDNIEERSTEALIGLKPFENTDIELSGGLINRDDLNGDRQQIKLTSKQKGFPSVNYRGERIKSKDFRINEDGNWLRQIGSLDYNLNTGIGKFSPVLGFESERREQKAIGIDSLSTGSFSFWDLRPGLTYNTGPLKLGFNFSLRDDNRVIVDSFADQSFSRTQNYILEFKPGPQFSTENQIGFRQRDFTETFENQNSTDTKGVLIRSVTNYSLFKSGWEGQFFYEANTQREALLQEAFIEVGPEFGQFTWDDSNEDGVQQIDEFFPEQTQNEGIFIKEFIPSDELFPVIDLQTRWRNKFDPSKLVKDNDSKSIWANIMDQFDINSTVEIRETNRTKEIKDIYLLNLSKFRDDSTTIDGQLFWQQELTLFPDDIKKGISITSNQLRSLNQRTTGAEERQTDNYDIESRFRVKDKYNFKSSISYQKQASRSERLLNRNFNIRSLKFSQGVDMLLNRSFQTGLTFNYTTKTDRFNQRSTEADLFKITSDTRAFLFKKVQTTARIEWQHVTINGPSTTFGQFELTEGAGIGSTMNWAIQGSYRISNLVRASINYNGRTVQNRGVIQTMRVIVSAVF